MMYYIVSIYLICFIDNNVLYCCLFYNYIIVYVLLFRHI